MLTSVDVSRARDIVVAAADETEVRSVSIDDALGRVLAEDVVNTVTLPPFDNSAMDGFAARADDLRDLPVCLKVGEDIPAGTAPNAQVVAGTCARIMTGAPVPAGADTVVPLEWTETEDGATIRILRSPGAGAHIRAAGSDVEPGRTLLERGRIVTPPVVATLAAAGRTGVRAYRRPSMAVLATGDELVDPSTEPGPGQIRNSNGPALAAHAAFSGARVTADLRVGDHPRRLADAIQRVADVDILVLSGGVSVGDRDHVQDVLRDLGAEILFWKVKQRPGKPLLFGRLNRTLVFGLPGNPSAATVCFLQYVVPALHVMTGRGPAPVLHAAIAIERLPKKAGLTTFLWGHAAVDERAVLRVRSTGSQSSGRILPQTRANCLIHLDAEVAAVGAGHAVHIEWLPWAAQLPDRM